MICQKCRSLRNAIINCCCSYADVHFELKRKIMNREDKVLLATPKNEAASLTVEDVKMAENTIIRLVQAAAFEVELKELRNISSNSEISRDKRRTLKKASSLFKLDPFLDENGIV